MICKITRKNMKNIPIRPTSSKGFPREAPFAGLYGVSTTASNTP